MKHRSSKYIFCIQYFECVIGLIFQLPVKVDIIKHPNEVDGKSTAPHARVISPDEVTIYTYPCIPDYDKEKVGVAYLVNGFLLTRTQQILSL